MKVRGTTKERILQAAIELFSNSGYSRTSMKSIAERAAVNETTIFRIFGTKKELFLEAFLILTPDTSRMNLAEYSLADDLGDQLAHLFANYMILHVEHMPAYRLSMLIDEIYDEDIYANSFLRIKGLISQLVTYLRNLHEVGKIKEVDYSAVAELMFSLFLVKATEYVDCHDDDVTIDEQEIKVFARQYADFFVERIGV